MNREFALLAGFVAAAAVLAGCATPGTKATLEGDSVQLQRILDQPNHGNENLGRLLGDAVWYDSPEKAQILLGAGAKPDNKELLLAAYKGQVKIARILLDHGLQAEDAIGVLSSANPYFAYGYDLAGLNLAEFNLSPDQAQRAIDFLKKLDRERGADTAGVVPVAAAAEAAHPRLSPSFHEAERPNDYALIVGVEKYDSLPAATYAEADAKAAARFVRALGVPERNMVTLTGARATRSGLAKQLEGWLANNVNKDSTVYFYYSGHGAPDPRNGQAYLVPIDGDPQYLAQTGYPLKRLYENLDALKAKRVIVMLDSCFSGAGGRSVLAKGARPLVNNVDTGFKSSDGKIAALTASGADQISGTDDATGHGLFTQYLLEGLNGAARDGAGRVTLKSLYGYLKPKVMDDAHRANREQVPQLNDGLAAGDVVLRDK